MYKFILGLSFFVTGVFSSSLISVSDAHAKVILKERVKFYTVTGSTGAELYKSMIKNGPDHGGNRKNALASALLKFDFKNDVFQIKRNHCVLTNLDIIVDVTYTYPKWRVSKKASNATRSAWKKFEKIAVLHEKEHAKIATKFAKDYEKALKKSRRSARLECAKQSVGEIFRTTYQNKKHNLLHRLFDIRDTKRGGRGYKALLELYKAE